MKVFTNLLVFMFIICYFSKAQTAFSVDKWKEYIESISIKRLIALIVISVQENHVEI